MAALKVLYGSGMDKSYESAFSIVVGAIARRQWNLLKTRGFSLVELLVVIAIITLLAGLLFPVLTRARAKARQAYCMSNLHQISIALTSYRHDHDDRLPNWLSNLYGAGGGGYLDDNRTPFLCLSDRSHGAEGSKPESMLGPPASDPNQFRETDDCSYNNDADRDAGIPRDTNVSACGYLYEFCAAPCTWDWATRLGKDGVPAQASAVNRNGDSIISWGEVKLYQLEHGDISNGNSPYQETSFPLVRCFHHYLENDYITTGGTNQGMTINVSYAGNVFCCPLLWENGDFQ